MTDEPQDRSFLKRWSTRKREAANSSVIEDWPDKDAQIQQAFPPIEDDINPLVANAEQSSEALEEKSGVVEEKDGDIEPLLTDADMPPIESLTASSDVSAFFNKGVSAALRKAALRYVFQQPEFNVRDGLNDYDGDYTVFEPLGDTITSDMKFHAARKEKNRLEAEAKKAEEALKAQQEHDASELEEDLQSEPAETENSSEETSTDESQIDSEESLESHEGDENEDAALQLAGENEETIDLVPVTKTSQNPAESV